MQVRAPWCRCLAACYSLAAQAMPALPGCCATGSSWVQACSQQLGVCLQCSQGTYPVQVDVLADLLLHRHCKQLTGAKQGLC